MMDGVRRREARGGAIGYDQAEHRQGLGLPGSGSRAEGENFTSAYTAARIYIHSLEEIVSFFDGLELVPPGVVPVRAWCGDGPAPDPKLPTATFLGGAALKP